MSTKIEGSVAFGMSCFSKVGINLTMLKIA